ncbi:hypothetical protein [Kingella sp. (in: b-proteobacteria)]|uniref:hypothetical protein n=1 Tax=Kingella sp. (in: b-proteobacteria) TaxID=2020713 RepID=UPI0026DCC09A|nr:hypothetical protein [Kingella sp. (in: b-proteobacteria)]
MVRGKPHTLLMLFLFWLAIFCCVDWHFGDEPSPFHFRFQAAIGVLQRFSGCLLLGGFACFLF